MRNRADLLVINLAIDEKRDDIDFPTKVRMLARPSVSDHPKYLQMFII
jgi:hypothetical protein